MTNRLHAAAEAVFIFANFWPAHEGNGLHGLRVEHRQVRPGRSLAWDLVQQLAAPQGSAAIVAENPVIMLSAVRKQWLKQIRRMQIERARSLKSTQILEITNQLGYRQSVRFSARPRTSYFLEADVTFATADAFVQFAPPCYVMYVTYDFPKEKLHLMTSWMPKNGVVVVYAKS